MKRASGIALMLLACGIGGWPGAVYARPLGHCGFIFSGAVINAAGFSGPIAGEGEFLADAQGHVTGSETFNVTGTVCSGTLDGTYTSSQDDTGTLTANFTPSTSGCPSGTLHLSYSAVDNDKRVYFVQTDPAKVVSGIAEKKYK